MNPGDLGRIYGDGESIVRQGEMGDCMYVIQKGQAEVLQEADGQQVRLSVLSEGDFFGEMALFERRPRSATVRALGDVRALTVDRRIFLHRVHEDPSFACRILQQMSERVRRREEEVTQLRNEQKTAGQGAG